MCGRYSQTEDAIAVAKRFGCEPIDLKPCYNQAPGQLAPIVAFNENKMLDMMLWGMKTHGSSRKVQRIINARSEDIHILRQIERE